MKGTIFAVALLLAALLPVAQAAPPQKYKNNGSSTATVVIKPQPMPTTLTSVTTNDAWIIGATVTSASGSTVNATIQCNESPNSPFLATTPIPSYTTYPIATPYMHWCPGGFSVLASASGLTYYVIWKE